MDIVANNMVNNDFIRSDDFFQLRTFIYFPDASKTPV